MDASIINRSFDRRVWKHFRLQQAQSPFLAA
jgi:hypothetical protein